LPELAVRKLKPYDTREYQTVFKGVSIRSEDVNPDIAEDIAEKLEGKSQDVRDAVRVARLSPPIGSFSLRPCSKRGVSDY
jgi:Holliday junction DNA helicase RuvB